MFNKLKWITRVIGLLVISKQISFVTAVLSECSDAVQTYLEDSPTAGTFADSMVFCTNSNKVIGVDSSTNPSKHLELIGGYYLFNGNSLASNSDTDKTKYALYLSTGAALQSNPADGYYINLDQTDKYIKCQGGSCTVESNPTDGSCSTNTIGKLFYDTDSVYICLDGTNSAKAFEAKKYLISYGASSIFSSSVTSDYYGVVSVTTNSITIDQTVTSSSEICVNTSLLVSALDGSCADGSTLYSLCSSGICQKICKVESGVNCSATTYYLVENENTSVPITGTSEGYLFYCATADTACKRIFEKGYYMNGGGSTFYCNGTAGNCKIETITAGTTCSATTVGKLALDNTDPVICLTSSISKKLSTDTGSYLVDYASNNIFSITTGKKGLVKIENNSVTLVTSGSGYVIEKDENPNIVTSTADDQGTLYSCTSGLCSLVDEDSIKTGVYINIGGDGTHIICNADGCKITTNPTDTTCSKGQLIIEGETLKMCLDDTNSVSFTTGSTTEKYLVSHDDGSIFADFTSTDKFGLLIVNSSTITIDTTYNNDYGVCVDATFKVTETLSSTKTTCTTNTDTKYGFCSNGVCYKHCEVTTGTNCIASTYYLVKDKTLSIPLITSATEGYLYYCSTANQACTEKIAKGYYVNNVDDAYQCNGTSKSCTKIGISATETCTTTTIGKLIKMTATDADNTSGTLFCLNYKTAAIEKKLTNEEGVYLLTFSDNNIFGVTTGRMGLISITENSATLLSSTGYCAEDGASSNILGTSTSESTILYLCTEGLCETVDAANIKIGYYRNLGGTTTNTSDYIKCSVSETNKVCKVIDVSTKADCSTSVNAGDLIYVSDDSEYKICLTTANPLLLDSTEGSTNGTYFVDASDEDNTDFGFGETKESSYILVDVDKENVFLHDKETGTGLYQYGDKTTLKLIDFSTESSTYCSSNNLIADKTPKEFLLKEEEEDDTTNYYELQE